LQEIVPRQELAINEAWKKKNKKKKKNYCCPKALLNAPPGHSASFNTLPQ